MPDRVRHDGIERAFPLIREEPTKRSPDSESDFHRDSVGIAAGFGSGVGEDSAINREIQPGSRAQAGAGLPFSRHIPPDNVATGILVQLVIHQIAAIGHLAGSGQPSIQADFEIGTVAAAHGNAGGAVRLGQGGVAGAEIQVGGGDLALIRNVDLGGQRIGIRD